MPADPSSRIGAWRDLARAGVELGTYELYLPDDAALAAIAVPVRLLVSEDGLPVFAEIAGRLGRRLGVAVATTPGTHATYHEHPCELAEIVRPFLRQVSGVKRLGEPHPQLGGHARGGHSLPYCSQQIGPFSLQPSKRRLLAGELQSTLRQLS